jgi:iron complex transport system substrate-binding protein
MANKKILGSGIIFVALIGTIVGIAIYNNYLNIFKEEGDRTITDFLGREIKIPNADDIEKIVGLESGCLRLLVYMEAVDLICGVEDIERNMDYGRPYIYAYPELTDLPSIGPQFGGDPELILGQEPDVIFITYETKEGADELQELTGIPVIVLGYGEDYGDLKTDYLYESLEIIGEVLDKEDRADDLIDYIESLFDDLDERTSNIPNNEKEWLYIGGIGHQGAHGITSTDTEYEPLKYINGKNSAETLPIADGHVFIDIEQLFQWENDHKLDYILVDGGGYDLCMQDLQNKTMGAGAGDLDCIRANPPRAIMTLPYNFYTVNFATVFVDAYYLGRRFFPANFSDIVYTNNAIYDDIYEEFLGKRVYNDMADYYSGGFHNITRFEIDNY